MQILLILSFALTVMACLFIGHAMAGGYAPYLGLLSAVMGMVGLFMPFMSEYNVLHRGFSKIGDNFKNLMGNEERTKGDVEIILPGQSKAPAEQYNLQKRTYAHIGVIIVLVLAALLLAYDAVNFYILADGLDKDTGPISNF